MATFQVVDELANNLAGGGGTGFLDLPADTFKAVLSNVAPTKAGSQVLADITQIAATGGYAAVTLTGVTFTETGGGTGIWAFTSAAFSWTASGADFATARYVVIYDDTPTSPADPIIGYVDYGTTFVVTNGSSFTVTPGGSGIFRMTVS
jgi:hypothetical protein